MRRLRAVSSFLEGGAIIVAMYPGRSAFRQNTHLEAFRDDIAASHNAKQIRPLPWAGERHYTTGDPMGICPLCGGVMMGGVDEDRGGNLVWDRTYHCDSCQAIFEDDPWMPGWPASAHWEFV